jgi:hypothetical protein
VAIVFKAALPALVRAVRAAFVTRGITATVAFGARAANYQLNQGPGGANRVVFIPGSGELVPVRLPGLREIRDPEDGGRVVATVQPIADHLERATVRVWALDPLAREDEERQAEAVVTLAEATMSAIHDAPGAFASLAFGATDWSTPAERTYGREFTFQITLRSPIYPAPRALAFPAAAVGRANE